MKCWRPLASFKAVVIMLRNLILIIALSAVATQTVVAAGQDLPDIGSPADTMLSKDKEAIIGGLIENAERILGVEAFRKIRRQSQF
jgi:hypothetical protein